MNIDRMTLVSAGGQWIVDVFLVPSVFKGEYQLKSISGLDAMGLDRRRNPRAPSGSSDAFIIGMQNRVIEFTIILNPYLPDLPENTANGLRDRIYRGIYDSKDGLLRLEFSYQGAGVVDIQGTIDKLEMNYNDAQPTLNISFNCIDPIFRGLYPEILTIYGGQFPESIQENVSTAPTGFSLEGDFTDTVETFEIFDIWNPDWKFRVDAGFLYDFVGGTGFQPGDHLKFSSNPSTRKLSVTRDADEINLIDKIDSSASWWPLIFPGDNRYALNTTDFFVTHIGYSRAFWGL